MRINGVEPTSCFGLRGNDENAATLAIGWCVRHSQTFQRELWPLFGVSGGSPAVAHAQTFGHDRGFTDLEIRAATSFHIIIEAKKGWVVPSQEQLSRYLPRLLNSPASDRRLVSVSAADAAWARNHLPSELGGIPVLHVSWSDLRAAAQRALAATRSPSERIWIDQLIAHLKDYGMTSNIFDAKAYVVSLNRSRIKAADPLTWIDVIVKDSSYFHPIGTNGWPVIAPAYIGFRWHSEFRSVHFIEGVETTDRIQDIDPRWPETSSPHFVYRLGPPMTPPRPMKLGNIHYSMRNWIAIDLLISGVATDYAHAIQLMKQRHAARGD